jgi:hypothetical protein
MQTHTHRSNRCMYVYMLIGRGKKERWAHQDRLQPLKKKGAMVKYSFALRFFSIFRLQSILF